MQFHHYTTSAQHVHNSLKRNPGKTPSAKHVREVMFQQITQQIKRDSPGNQLGAIQFDFENVWQQEQRPFYNVYPTIIPMLSKLDLDQVTGSHLNFPHGLNTLLVRFPVGHELDGEIRTLWCYKLDLRKDQKLVPGITVAIDHGELMNDIPVLVMKSMPLTEQSVKKSLDDLPVDPSAKRGKQLNPETVRKALSLVCTLLLLGEDNELLEPDIRAKDQQKAAGGDLETLVARARAKGKRGWNVGKGIEVIPHYRRPHPALVWTGAGRAIPKVVMRKGTIVHKQTVGNVPTGYLGTGDLK